MPCRDGMGSSVDGVSVRADARRRCPEEGAGCAVAATRDQELVFKGTHLSTGFPSSGSGTALQALTPSPAFKRPPELDGAGGAGAESNQTGHQVLTGWITRSYSCMCLKFPIIKDFLKLCR